jgi:hypothetical protein
MNTNATADGKTTGGFNVTFNTTAAVFANWGSSQDASWTAESEL